MVKTRKIVLASNFKGEPKLEDFRVEEEELPPLKDGQILTEAVYFSVDPFQRIYSSQLKIGKTIFGAQVARIVESRATDFPAGRHIVGYWGWQDRSVVDVGPDVPFIMSPPMLVPDFGDLPISLSLGVLGMPGITAYFGLLDVTKPKAGEVVVVTGAAGAVGSIVGQVARIKGCTVIGFAGSDAKIKWLTEELGFHHAFNYKTTDHKAVLKKAAPGGIDVFYDNVGGELHNTVVSNMRDGGRIAVSGLVSSYNTNNVPSELWKSAVLDRGISRDGVAYTKYHDRWDEGIGQMLQWIKEGKLKYKETITEGFHNTPKAFIGMLRGENFGKAVVRL